MTPSVDIVIPSYNGRDLLEKNLPAVRSACSSPGASIFVADDASTDRTCDFLRDQWPEVRVIRAESRRGFAHTVNLGASAGKADMILALNNDIAPSEGFLAPLLQSMSEPDVFAAVSRILQRRKDGRLFNQSGQFIFYSEGRIRIRQLDHELIEHMTQPVNVPIACGACSLFRRDMFERLAGFDTLLSPFYWEDTDLSYRALKRGLKIVYRPDSTVYHEHAVTVGREHDAGAVNRVFWRNYCLFNEKNLTDDRLRKEFHKWLTKELLRLSIRGQWSSCAGVIDAVRFRGAAKDRRIVENAQATLSDEALWKRIGKWEDQIREME